MGTAAAKTSLRYADYLAAEALADVRHEYVGGECFAMAGGTRAHALVQTGFLVALARHLSGRPCRPAGSDARVYLPKYGDAVYPDVHVVCGKAERGPEDPDAVVNPVLVVEVLSPSTERWDRGGKFERYESLPSLQDIVLAEADRRRVEVFHRNEDGSFTRHVYASGEVVHLAGLGVDLPLDELYALREADEP